MNTEAAAFSTSRVFKTGFMNWTQYNYQYNKINSREKKQGGKDEENHEEKSIAIDLR